MAAAPIAVKLAAADGGSMRGEFGGDHVYGVGDPKPEAKAQYKGQWRVSDGKYLPDGFGLEIRGIGEWVGEYSEGGIKGYGVIRIRGQVAYAGEWGQGDETSVGPLGYGASFDQATPSGGIWAWDAQGHRFGLSRAIPY